MEKYIEYICCNQPPSSSSSTKIFCDCEKLCSPCGCYRYCKSTFFNDHAYSILKRICHKIIKNHSRQRCREHYSVFDGGNSTSIRPVFKGQKDGTDLFNNWMHTESVFRRNGCRENEDFCVTGSLKNGNKKSYYAWNVNVDTSQNSKRNNVSGEKNENNIGRETKNFRKRAARDEWEKKIDETVYKKNINLFENELSKYNKKETKELKKRKGEVDYNKDGSKKSAGVKSYIDDKFGRNKNQGTTEGKDRKNRESKLKQIKIKKNVDQGDINKNEEKEGKAKKNIAREAKQTEIEKNIDQLEINKNEEKEGKDKKNRTSNAKKTKIDKNVDQVEINMKEKNEDSRNRRSKANQTKIDKNVDQGEINMIKEKEGKDIRYITNKAKQSKIDKNMDQGEINKNEKSEEKNRKNKTSKAKQTKIEKNLSRSEIYRNKDSSTKLDKGKGKQLSELNQYTIRENNNERDKQKEDQDNKLVKIGSQQIGSKEKHNYYIRYQAMSKKKNSDIFVKKNRVDDNKSPNVNDNSAKYKFKTGSGRGSRLFENEVTFLKKGTNKGKSSKMLANRKLYSSKGIIGMAREIQSCRYVRPCDVLRVKLEERDLSRCIACFLPCRPYISCSSYQCGLPCG